MAVPTDQEYSTATIISTNTAVLDEITDNGSSGCTVKIYDSADTLLSTVPLTDPPGTVDGGTGQLTLTASGPDTSAAETEYAAYCEIHDAVGTWITRMPCVLGADAVSERLVLNTLLIVAGAPVSILTLTIG